MLVASPYEVSNLSHLQAPPKTTKVMLMSFFRSLSPNQQVSAIVLVTAVFIVAIVSVTVSRSADSRERRECVYGEISSIRETVRLRLHDPSSMKDFRWDYRRLSDRYEIKFAYRAKNLLGAYVLSYYVVETSLDCKTVYSFREI